MTEWSCRNHFWDGANFWKAFAEALMHIFYDLYVLVPLQKIFKNCPHPNKLHKCWIYLLSALMLAAILQRNNKQSVVWQNHALLIFLETYMFLPIFVGLFTSKEYFLPFIKTSESDKNNVRISISNPAGISPGNNRSTSNHVFSACSLNIFRFSSNSRKSSSKVITTNRQG